MGMNSRSRIENFKGIYRRAKKEGLRLKAHVGEWGTAKDIRTAVEELELDEVQHGIAAAGDESVIRFLAENKIRLNITPTSNVLLEGLRIWRSIRLENCIAVASRLR